MFVLSNNHRQGRRGSALVIALLLVLVGTFGMTAWFSLVVARSMEVNAKEDGMRRRVTLNGVKEIARQVASQGMLADDNGNASSTIVAMPANGGNVDFAPWTATAYTASSNLRYDQIGGIPAQSFTTDLVAKIDDSGGPLAALDYNVQLRSYVPAIGGDLLTIHEAADASTAITTNANLLVNGRTVVWDSTNALAHRTSRFHSSARDSTLSMLDLSGNPVLPDNEAFAPRSTGNDFIGRLKKVNGSESSANRYTSRLATLGFVTIPSGSTMGDLIVDGYSADVAPGGEPRISIDVDHPALPHLFIESHIIITLIGQTTAAEYTAAGSLQPRLIVANNPPGNGTDRNLDLILAAENNRPIVFAMSRGVAGHAHQLIVTYDWVPSGGASLPFPRWRSIFDFENCATVFDINASGVSELHLYGGISTDATIDTSPFPGIRMLRDTQVPNAGAIAGRVGFVEIFRN